MTSQEYFEILSDILKPFSFSISDLYEDPYGGKVADYFKGKERISCIVSIQHVQILSFLDDVFKEKVFERSGEVKLEISKYVESLLASRHDDRLDASKGSQPQRICWSSSIREQSFRCSRRYSSTL